MKWSKGVRILLHLDCYLMNHCVDDQGCEMLSGPLCCDVSIFIASNGTTLVINELLSMLKLRRSSIYVHCS